VSNPSTDVPAADACTVALLLIDRMQTLPKGQQVAGVFFLAAILKRQLGLDLNELMNQADRRYDTVNTYFKRESQAITDYTLGELR
jgi:F420-0:gamma-glutamyl ligase-like protein